MASVPGRVFSRYELVNRARGYEYEGYERTIDSHIRNLRRKIGADPRAPGLIDTVTGTGYRLAITCDRAPAQPPAAGQDQAAAPGRGRCLPPGTSVLPGSALRRWGSAIYPPYGTDSRGMARLEGEALGIYATTRWRDQIQVRTRSGMLIASGAFRTHHN